MTHTCRHISSGLKVAHVADYGWCSIAFDSEFGEDSTALVDVVGVAYCIGLVVGAEPGELL